MLIPLNRWREVRHHFTEEERSEIGVHITGESLHPVGQIVDLRKLTLRTRAKLELHFSKDKVRAAGQQITGPKHTFESVVTELRQGLQDRTIVLDGGG